MFKIGIILSIVGIIWISAVFLDGDRVSEAFILEPSNSYSIELGFVGDGIGYYKVFIPEFTGNKIFARVIDTNSNVISEQSIHTKMSLGYFDYKKTGEYTVKVTNISENPVNLEVEFGETNSKNMISSGVIVLVGAILIIGTSYMKLQNYKITQPDENIS